MKNKQEIEARLYDADGTDREVDLENFELESIGDKQLLWVCSVPREKKTLEKVFGLLRLQNAPVDSVLDLKDPPGLNKFDDFYQFFVISVSTDASGRMLPAAIDFVAGKNFVVAVHDTPIEYFREFSEREKGETRIGELDSESFVAALLDFHIVSYFRALELIETAVDETDEQILRRDWTDEEFFDRAVSLRAEVARLRRWFLPQRGVFYALSRPDFKQIADSDSFENFRTLNQRFETAADSIENARNSILSLFDLYVSKSSHRMNQAMRRLTFITLLVGGMGVIAGALGMNFKEDFFDSSNGFWIAVSVMLVTASAVTLLAWRKNWI